MQDLGASVIPPTGPHSCGGKPRCNENRGEREKGRHGGLPLRDGTGRNECGRQPIVGALNMKQPSPAGQSEYQATRSGFVKWIIFYDFSAIITSRENSNDEDKKRVATTATARWCLQREVGWARWQDAAARFAHEHGALRHFAHPTRR